jgi:hypothetical protein
MIIVLISLCASNSAASIGGGGLMYSSTYTIIDKGTV